MHWKGDYKALLRLPGHCWLIYSTVPRKVSERHSFRNNEKCNLTPGIYRRSVRIWGMLWSHKQAVIQKKTIHVPCLNSLLSAVDSVNCLCLITKLDIKFQLKLSKLSFVPAAWMLPQVIKATKPRFLPRREDLNFKDKFSLQCLWFAA